MIYANVDRNGTVYFDEKRINGLLVAGKHESPEILKAAVSAIARHAYDGQTYIVAGVRDAEDPDEAFDALCAFEDRLEAAIIDAEHEAAHEVAS